MIKEPRPRLYRGTNAAIWKAAMIKRGWPAEAATMMAGFLVGHFRAPPDWKALHDPPRANPATMPADAIMDPPQRRPGWREKNR